MADNNNPVSRFRQFFAGIDLAPVGPDTTPPQDWSITIDWQRLADFDTELAQQLLDQPDPVIGYAREALATLIDPPTAVDGPPQVRVRNLDANTSPDLLATGPVGHFVSVSGTLVAVSDVRPTLKLVTVECERCGTITKGRYFGLTNPEIESCRSCGRATNQPVITESVCVDTQYGRLLVAGSTAKGDSETIHVRLDGDLQPVTAGATVTVTGVVRPCQQSELDRQPTIQTRFIDCSDIVLDDRTHDPTPPSPTWTLGDLARQPTYLAELANGLAPSVPGFWKAKLVFTLLFVQPTFPGSQSSRHGPNILIVAPETGHRSQLLRTCCEHSQHTHYHAISNASSQPLIADIKKVASNWWVETGPLAQTDGGIAVVDGIQDAATQYPRLTQALTQSQIKLAKAGIETTLDTCGAVLATAAPRIEAPSDPTVAARLDDDMLSSFDLSFGDSSTATAGQQELTRVWAETENAASQSATGSTDTPDTDMYRAALKQARSIEQPVIGEKVRQRIRASQLDDSVLAWLATALARLYGHQRVRLSNVNEAKEISELIPLSA